MPVYPEQDDFLIYAGTYFMAEWYYTTTGEMPAYEYYKRLSETDQDRLDNMIIYFCDRPHGLMLPTSMYRIEDPVNKIYTFKPRKERFFNFITEGAKVIVTNAYHKHSQQMTKKDLEHLKIAARYREDYLRRKKEATYYAE
jgi:hypothetical protein